MKKNFALLYVILLVFGACKKDDDGAPEIVIRDYGEVAIEDDAEIVKFLETHFYYLDEDEDVDLDANDRNEIVIDTISGDNANRTPLMDLVSIKTIKVEDVDHNLYYIVARQGDGEKPSAGANVMIRYKGIKLDNERFDISDSAIEFPLLGDNVVTFSVVRGFRELAVELKASALGYDYDPNGDGTISWPDDYGIGFVIFPSGLGYYNNAPSGSAISAYDPLIFTIDMLRFEEIDHDFITTQAGNIYSPDGILTKDEDVDGDGNPANDDTDGNGQPNYLDPDDDGDGILTEFEYDENNDNIPDDENGDGIPDYLDNKS